MNKSFGYVLFENVEDAKKALESLQGKQLIGFESYYKPLIVQYFIPKEKRNNMTQNPNFYNMPPPPPSPPLMYPGVQTPYMPFMIPMPLNMMQNNQFRNQQYMRYHGNMKNNDYRKYNNNYRGRGGNRGGKNYQKRNNNNNNTKGNKDEKKIEFDYEHYNKLESDEDKKVLKKKEKIVMI